MAGTTVNEDNLVYKTLRDAISYVGFNFSLHQVMAHGAGKEKKQAIRTILKTFENKQDEHMVNRIYEHFIEQLTAAYATKDILPQNNAEATFKALKQRNILAVLNTGYDRSTAQSILDKLGWKEGVQIDGLVTASDVSKNRPDPDMIHFAMQRFHILNSGEVAKIGDSTVDIEEGRNAGCGLSIGITTGAHTTEQLKTANPDKIIDDLMELLPLLA